jgi:phosphoglycerate-specific signal transduction histidine kinase
MIHRPIGLSATETIQLQQDSIPARKEYLPASSTKIFLHQLVNQLVKSLLPLTTLRKNLVLNHIPRELMVTAEENMLAYVLWNLINSAVNSTQDDCIHIQALSMDEYTMIAVKDVGTYFYHTISSDYRQVQYIAEKLGGSISICNDKNNSTNVCFRISKDLLAA